MSHPSRLTERRAQAAHEDQAFHNILEENAKLQEDLSRMVAFKRNTTGHASAAGEYAGSRDRKGGSSGDLGNSLQSRRDTAMTFGDNQPTKTGFHSGSNGHQSAGEESRQSQRHPESERIADLEDKLRETTDALEYMKKRERALQEEVKTLTQLVAKKDNALQTLDSKNRILLATKIEVESKMADILDQADEVLVKYDRLRDINLILQEKLASMESELIARSQFNTDEKKVSHKQIKSNSKSDYPNQETDQKSQRSQNSNSRSQRSEIKVQDHRSEATPVRDTQEEAQEEEYENEGEQEDYDEEEQQDVSQSHDDGN